MTTNDWLEIIPSLIWFANFILVTVSFRKGVNRLERRIDLLTIEVSELKELLEDEEDFENSRSVSEAVEEIRKSFKKILK